jgi:hypothetical protein
MRIHYLDAAEGGFAMSTVVEENEKDAAIPTEDLGEAIEALLLLRGFNHEAHPGVFKPESDYYKLAKERAEAVLKAVDFAGLKSERDHYQKAAVLAGTELELVRRDKRALAEMLADAEKHCEAQANSIKALHGDAGAWAFLLEQTLSLKFLPGESYQAGVERVVRNLQFQLSVAKTGCLKVQTEWSNWLFSLPGARHCSSDAAAKRSVECQLAGDSPDSERLDFLGAHYEQISMRLKHPYGEAFIYRGEEPLRQCIDHYITKLKEEK